MNDWWNVEIHPHLKSTPAESLATESSRMDVISELIEFVSMNQEVKTEEAKFPNNKEPTSQFQNNLDSAKDARVKWHHSSSNVKKDKQNNEVKTIKWLCR